MVTGPRGSRGAYAVCHVAGTVDTRGGGAVSRDGVVKLRLRYVGVVGVLSALLDPV